MGSCSSSTLQREDSAGACFCFPTSMSTRRIILLGRNGAGKSSLANTIFGKDVFNIDHSPNSGKGQCQANNKSVYRKNITLIDTPGFFDPGRSDEELKPDILKCITECAPGLHAFLIVLKVEKFTDQDDIITKICQYFSTEALKYAVVVFTHGDHLPKGMKIEEFVHQNECLSDLVQKCGGRCHVVDNKYWKKKKNSYRSNKFQVAQLLNTIEKITKKGGCYTNGMLQAVEREIQREEERIRQSSGNMPHEETREQAKNSVLNMCLIRFIGVATGGLLGVFLSGVTIFGVAAFAVSEIVKALTAVGAACGPAEGAAAKGEALEEGTCVSEARAAVGSAAGLAKREEVEVEAGAAVGKEAVRTAVTIGAVRKVASVSAAAVVAAGGVIGGLIGYNAAGNAQTTWEAAEKAAGAVWNNAEAALTKGKDVWDQMSQTNQNMKEK